MSELSRVIFLKTLIFDLWKNDVFAFYFENYLSNKKISNNKEMHHDARSNQIFFISNFYAFRLFIDYRESTVQFMRRVPLFDPGLDFIAVYAAFAACHPLSCLLTKDISGFRIRPFNCGSELRPRAAYFPDLAQPAPGSLFRKSEETFRRNEISIK